jgi:hypothetical protein
VRSLFATVVLLPLAFLSGAAQAAPDLGEWVAANTTSTEKTVCSRQVDGDLFFVAMASDGKLRLGNRLDMTGYTETHGYSIAWSITNDKGGSVVAKVPPVPVVQRYVKEGSKLYADNVEYQTLNAGFTTQLHVDLRIEKCAVRSHDSQSCQSARKAYTVKLCEIRL